MSNSSTEGLFSGLGSIMRLITCSSWSLLLALGENFIRSPCLSFYQTVPFWGRFMPEANSRREAPNEKISAFFEILSVMFIVFLSSSGAIQTESPSTSSSLIFETQLSSMAQPKSPSFTVTSAVMKKLEGLISKCTKPQSCTCLTAQSIWKKIRQT